MPLNFYRVIYILRVAQTALLISAHTVMVQHGKRKWGCTTKMVHPQFLKSSLEILN